MRFTIPLSVVSCTGCGFRKRKMDRKKMIAFLLLLNRNKRKSRFWVHPLITIMNSIGNYFTKYYALRTEEGKNFCYAFGNTDYQ